MTFEEASQKFLILKKAETSKTNISYYMDKIPIINRYIGSIEVSKIDKFTIAEFTIKQQERNSTISNRTLNYYRDIIKRVLKDVCNIELEINSLKVKKKVIPDLSDEVINEIFNHLLTNYNKSKIYSHYYKYYFITRLILDTGVRINELVNIKVKNLDLVSRTIRLEVTKNDKERYVFFSEEVKKIYYEYIKKYETSEYLFPGKEPGSHLTKKAIGKVLYKIQVRLDLNVSISPHKWRHTMATRFLASGGTVVVLHHILGHENIETTMIYEHLNKKQLHKMYNEVKSKEALTHTTGAETS